MDTVYTLTRVGHDSNYTEEIIYTSKDIFVILDKMFSMGYAEVSDVKIYVTNNKNDHVEYKEWRRLSEIERIKSLN